MKRWGAITIAMTMMSLSAADAQDTTLTGLWSSKRYFGPEVRGELRITRAGDRWQASVISSAGARSARENIVTQRARRIRRGRGRDFLSALCVPLASSASKR
jgi:hypothetical protein